MTYTDFLALWNDPTDDPGLAEIKAGGVKAIRAASGLSQVEFAEEYEIPSRTIEAWETENQAHARTAPEYVRSLLAYAVLCHSDPEEELDVDQCAPLYKLCNYSHPEDEDDIVTSFRGAALLLARKLRAGGNPGLYIAVMAPDCVPRCLEEIHEF